MPAEIELNPGDHILVSRTDKLGDLILALPFVETLKVRYPECQVDVMASLYASPILENNDRIDGIVRVQNEQLVSSRHYRKELEQKIQRAHYKVAVLLYPERHISRLLYRIGLPVRIGTAGRFHSVYYTHRLLHSRKANKKHESEYNLDFLKFFRDGETITLPTVYPASKETAHAERVLGNAGIDGPFIVVHPGSGGSAERWPMERFVHLYAELEQAGYRVVITGSENEGQAFARVAEAEGISDVTSVAGQTDLRTLAALLAKASALVANSTGPLHLAVAVGINVVGLYPSRHIMSPVRWGPLGSGNEVLQPDAECQCPAGQCRCMESISVARVSEATRKVYGSRTS